MTEIRWDDFCDKESTRFAIREPRVIGGWKLATESRVCIGIPTTEPDSPPSVARFPNVAALLAPVFGQVGDMTPWPIVEPCVCFPASEKTCECPTCGSHVHERRIKGERCNCKVIVGGRSIASPLFDKISRLPNVGYFIPAHPDFEHQVWFRFDGGGVGIVMTLDMYGVGASDKPIRKALALKEPCTA